MLAKGTETTRDVSGCAVVLWIIEGVGDADVAVLGVSGNVITGDANLSGADVAVVSVTADCDAGVDWFKSYLAWTERLINFT